MLSQDREVLRSLHKYIFNPNHIGVKYSLILYLGGGGTLSHVSSCPTQSYIFVFIILNWNFRYFTCLRQQTGYFFFTIVIMMRTEALFTEFRVAWLNLPPPPLYNKDETHRTYICNDKNMKVCVEIIQMLFINIFLKI